MYFVITFLYLGTFFLFYFPHYFVTSLSLPFLKKHLGTHSNEQMKQTNKRQKNNEYHNWSRKFFPQKLCFKSKFSHHSARGEYFLPVVFSYPVSREIRSVPWALNLKQVQLHERTTTDWLQKWALYLWMPYPFYPECHTHFTQNPLLFLRLIYKLSCKRYYSLWSLGSMSLACPSKISLIFPLIYHTLL